MTFAFQKGGTFLDEPLGLLNCYRFSSGLSIRGWWLSLGEALLVALIYFL